MRLAPVDLHSIKLEVPLPFSLVDSRGVLLAQKGFVFQTEKILNDLGNHESGFYVDFADLSNPNLRAAEKDYVNRMLRKLHSQSSLEDVSKVQVKYVNDAAAAESGSEAFDWLNMVEICNSMLHTRDSDFFKRRLASMSDILAHQLAVNPDETLLALFYLAENQAQYYSATHCMLVCAIGVLTATTVLQWPAADVELLLRSALTMNIGMVALQDTLTAQRNPPDMSQRFIIREHGSLSAQTLELFGIQDPSWLAVVRGHHAVIADPLNAVQPTDRIIGLIQRVDQFSAKLSARAARKAQHSSEAMKSIYFNADAKLDAMGAAILKAVGIYRPGSFVKLASGELALVIRRGKNTATPIVAAILNRDGIPRAAAAIRNTAEEKYAVLASVPSVNVHLKLNLEKILELSLRSA